MQPVLPPYCLIREVGDTFYISGHTGLSMMDRTAGSTFAEQMRDCLANLDATLKSFGLGPKNVLKTTVFLRNIDDFSEMNSIYSSYFLDPYPARSTVAVAALPKLAINTELLVEIEAVAVKELAL